VLTVTATYEGEGRFRVLATDEEAGFEERIFNETGPFEGDTTLEVDPDAMLVLDVEANGPWQIVIEPAS
jgi:hypothetical protein